MVIEMNEAHEVSRYDVIVVGSGAALIGAYAAASRGLRTLVIEKTEFVGGTTAYSGAGIWLPGNAAEHRAGVEDTPEMARTYLDALIGDDAPVALRESFLDAGPRLIDELETNPLFQWFEWNGVPDYFAEVPGWSPKGRTIFPPPFQRSLLGNLEPLVRRTIWSERWGVPTTEDMIGGQALIGRALLAFMETGNGTLKVNTPLVDLVVEDGAVVGIEALTDGKPARFYAERGVLLGAGGFERNGELRKKYQSPLDDEWTQGAPGNTGDALLAGMRVGAATDLLDEAWYAPGVVMPDTRPTFFTTVWSGIWVNSAGERFMNERLPYDRAGHEMLKAHQADGASTLPTQWVFDQRQLDNEASFSALPVNPHVTWFDVDKFLDSGVLKRADTIEELAKLIDVPVENLVRSIETFNSYARSGTDEEFHRGETPWDLLTANMAGPHTDGANPCLGVIDKPPFYATPIVLSDLGTKGGLRTDGSARVLREDGSVIPGLYASGNTMAPMSGRIYAGAGVPVGSSMVFSYLAALDMKERG